jgi:hypothetical protein
VSRIRSQFNSRTRRLAALSALALLGASASGCYFVEFFRRSPSDGGGGGASDPARVYGQPLGDQAGGIDEAALALVYEVPATKPPAPIRLDPDLFVRRLLRAFRPEGAALARQMGEVEQYRELLGGASDDFLKAPQETYDATSLLAVLKVAEEACHGIVAPNSYQHEGWETVLPHGAEDEDGNVRWLMQRLTGRPAGAAADAQVAALIAIMRAEEATINENWWARDNAYAKYIPVCAAVALDAEAMFL